MNERKTMPAMARYLARDPDPRQPRNVSPACEKKATDRRSGDVTAEILPLGASRSAGRPDKKPRPANSPAIPCTFYDWAYPSDQ